MRFCAIVLSLLLLASCTDDKLPVYGGKVAVNKTVDGKTEVDSVDYTLPDFSFIDQDSAVIDASTINGKIYVADFFFTSCPSICPKMKKEMLRIYDKYKTDERVLLLSYSIDPARDSVARLKSYCAKLGIDNSAK